MNTHIRGNEDMRDSQLLDNGSVSTFSWQRIEAGSNELFEMLINIRFASKLRKEATVSSSSVHHRVQKSSVQSKSRDSPAEQIVQKLQRELQTRLLFVCNRFVK
jgi:hypothetical protein